MQSGAEASPRSRSGNSTDLEDYTFGAMLGGTEALKDLEGLQCGVRELETKLRRQESGQGAVALPKKRTF